MAKDGWLDAYDGVVFWGEKSTYLPFFEKIKKKFGSLNFCRTFAIPNQSGGGEMVDTLL